MLRKLTLITLALALVAGAAIFTGCNDSSITGTDSETGNSRYRYSVFGVVTEDGDPIGAMLRVYPNTVNPPLIGSDGTNENGEYRIDINDEDTGYYLITCQRNNEFSPSKSDIFYYNGTGDVEVDFEY